MPLEEVRFYCEFVDRDTGEKTKQEYVMDSNTFSFILKQRLTWSMFYSYLNSQGTKVG